MPARSSILRLLIALLFILILFPLSQASGAGAPLPDLLGSAQSAAPATAGTPQPAGSVKRARSTTVNLAQVETARGDLDAGRTPGALAVSLFSDTRLVAHFEQVEHLPAGGYTLSGHIDGSPFSEIHLSLVDGALFASLNTSQGLFRISSPDGQTAIVTQVDPGRLPPEEERVPTPAQATAPAAAPQAPAAVTVGPSTTDDGSRIDVYVGYTTAARTAAGGSALIQAQIATAISETNTGYANSGVNQRVVLVGSGEYAYSETGFNWNTALSQWSNPSDAVFGPAHTLRNTLKADEMVLLVNDPTYCGLAWLMTSGSISTSFSVNSFAVVNWTCAAGYYSFGHEMGHNMGANHDRLSAGGQQGAYPYSYGYQWFDAVDNVYYRTIMAYNVFGGDIRINYWSNPNVSYLGRNATGVDTSSASSAYNALTLNNTAPFVAMFEDGNSPAAPSNLVVTTLGATAYQLDWTDNSTDEWRFRIERTLSGANAWAEIGTAAANAVTYTDTTAASGTAYQYRVLSDNGNGRSASNIAASPQALPPGKPVVTAIPGATTVSLSWAPVSGAEGYHVERWTGSQYEVISPLITLSDPTTYLVTQLTKSTSYQFRVTALSSVSNNTSSDPLSVSTLGYEVFVPLTAR